MHISESDRATAGTGQAHWRKTFDTLAKQNDDSVFTIKAFGPALPSLATATKI